MLRNDDLSICMYFVILFGSNLFTGFWMRIKFIVDGFRKGSDNKNTKAYKELWNPIQRFFLIPLFSTECKEEIFPLLGVMNYIGLILNVITMICILLRRFLDLAVRWDGWLLVASCIYIMIMVILINNVERIIIFTKGKLRNWHK